MIDGDDCLDADRIEPSTWGGSHCPDDSILSLYIDGQLDETARGRIRDHLDRCDDCREVVATAVQAHLALTAGAPTPAADPRLVVTPAAEPSGEPALDGRRPIPPWLWATAAAAAIVLAVRLGGGQAPGPEGHTGSAWQQIAAAVGTERSLEPRLSRLPDHLPLAPPLRGDGTATDFARQSLPGKLAAAVGTATAGARFDAHHAAAVASLLFGDREDAIRQLQQLATEAPGRDTRVAVLADMSAARLANGQPVEALKAAREALQLDGANAAAHFNEALALERSGQADAAARAWRAVAADPNQGAPWQDEARRHLRQAEGR
ncbi:MAG: zf-HC2 domain-containing protein [Vicinamibacterales bacterium]